MQCACLQEADPTEEAAKLPINTEEDPGQPVAGPAASEAPAEPAAKGKGKKRTREDILEREKNKQQRAREAAAQKQAWTDLKHNTSVYVQGLPEDVTEGELMEVSTCMLPGILRQQSPVPWPHQQFLHFHNKLCTKESVYLQRVAPVHGATREPVMSPLESCLRVSARSRACRCPRNRLPSCSACPAAGVPEVRHGEGRR